MKWYGEPLPSAQKLCPRTVELVNRIPGVKAALFKTIKLGGAVLVLWGLLLAPWPLLR